MSENRSSVSEADTFIEMMDRVIGYLKEVGGTRVVVDPATHDLAPEGLAYYHAVSDRARDMISAAQGMRVGQGPSASPEILPHMASRLRELIVAEDTPHELADTFLHLYGPELDDILGIAESE
jgi:hypothetical protein